MADIQETETGEAVQQIDLNDVFLNVPAGKLDADQYSAEDLDGVTESVFGSGNVAYASMQASITDAVLNASQAQESRTEGTAPGANTDRPVQSGADVLPGSDSGAGGYTSSTVGSVGASQLSSDDGRFAPAGSGLDLGNSIGGGRGLNVDSANTARGGNTAATNTQNTAGGDNVNISGDTTTNIQTINNEAAGPDVTNVTINELNTTLDETFETINQTIETYIDQITNLSETLQTVIGGDIINLGDTFNTVTNVTETVTAITEQTVQTVTQIVDATQTALTTIIDNSVGSVTNIAGDVIELVSINQLGDTLSILGGKVTTIQQVVNQITQKITNLDVVTPLGDAVITKTNILNAVLEKTVVIVDKAVGPLLDGLGIGDSSSEGDVDASIELIPDALVEDALPSAAEAVEQLAEGIESVVQETGLDIAPVVEAVTPVVEAAEDIAQGLDDAAETAAGIADGIVDTVEAVIDETPVSLIVDPVEDLIGDIDLTTDAAFDLLGIGGNETDNGAGDQDVVLESDLGLVDGDLAQFGTDIALDPIEEITGDIDLDVGAALDLLDQTADPLVNDGVGGSVEETVTSVLGDTIADALDDTIETIVGDTNIDLDIGADLLGGDTDSGDAEGDTDITLETGIDLIDQTILDDTTLSIDIDPVEAVTGDIDLTLNTNVDAVTEDILGDVVDDAIDIDDAIALLNSDQSDLGNSVESVFDGGDEWTETALSDASGLFDDLVNGTTGGDEALPDPVGTVSEGLGVLHIEPEVVIGKLGGLFG